MGKIYMIVSQKGGVGKTTTTLNLADSLQAAGKRVLMVDFDSQANLTTCFGLENTGELENTIGHLMVMTMEDEDLPTMKKCVRIREGVALLPSSIYLSVADAKLRLEMGAETMLSEILEPLRDAYDYILIDTCPSLGMLDIDAIRPFKHHPFHLYEGERLDEMVESINEHGILNPVIVRKMHFGYEMLSGYNRQNAGKLAGLTQIPAVVKENLPDAEAYVYVIETNLMQRSFTDMKISEKAAVLAERYDKVLYQRKKDEIIEELKALENFSEKGGHCDYLSVDGTSGHSDHKQLNRENLGDEYGLSGSSVARLLRVNELIPKIKNLLNQGGMSLLAAVQLSYLPEKGQQLALEAAKESGIRINKTIAARVRNAPLTQQAIREAVTGVEKEEPYDPAAPCVVYKPIRLSADIREKYFPDTEIKEKDVERTIDKA